MDILTHSVKTGRFACILLVMTALVSLGLGGRAYAAPTAQGIAQAFQSNAADRLAAWFGARVDLQLLDAQAVYGKEQAKVLLQDFLNQHPVSSFNVAFTNSRGPKTFIVANMRSGSHRYRVNIFIQGQGGEATISQVEITHANKD